MAQEFILTAVARKNLKQAYELAGPQIRQGQTLKEWMTGNIAVVPYPVEELDLAPMKVDYSYKNEALIQVALLPKKGSKVKGQLFAMQLNKVGEPLGRQLVGAQLEAAGPLRRRSTARQRGSRAP